MVVGVDDDDDDDDGDDDALASRLILELFLYEQGSSCSSKQQ